MKTPVIKPASAYAANYGVKSIIYGRAGTGKTPIINTAPRPLLLSVEPGLKSMASSNVPTVEAHDAQSIDDFFEWFFNSNETGNYDTLAIDSGSQIAEVVLSDMLVKYKDGRQVYGEMGKKVTRWFNDLFYYPNKHIIVICKEGREELGSDMTNVNGVVQVNVQIRLRPYFPGNELNVKIPHQYDEIFHIDYRNVPGVGNVPALLTTGNDKIYARDRSGKLDKIERPDWGYIIKKCS